MAMKSFIDEKRITATVVAAKWERIFLYLDVKVEYADPHEREGELFFYAVNEMYYSPAAFRVVGKENDVYHLKMNVTNGGENTCVPSGEYRIIVCRDDCKMADCETNADLVGKMPDLSRTFLYAEHLKSYTVTFYVEEDADTLPFRFCILAASETTIDFPGMVHLWQKLNLIGSIKASWFSSKNIIRVIYAFYRRIYAFRRKNTILFMSEQNSVIASNLKAVSERMKERGMEKEYRLIFSARPAAAQSQSIFSWIGVIKKMAQSGLIFLDDHAPLLDWLKLGKDTKLIQLWHAGAGFKSSGYSRWGHIGVPGVSSCHRQYNFGIAGSKNIAPFFSEVWGINDEQVLPTGMPRMDEFLKEDYRQEKVKQLYERYPVCKGKKVMLYAPTYRGRNKREAHYPYRIIDFEGLYKACEDEYVVLFKMHPWVSAKVPIEKKYQDKFIDVSKYPNINDLLYITDLLVTDYSSNIFEYSLMRKPMLFFAYDKIQYSLSRGFHRDYEESAPGKVCYTFEEFLEAFRKKDFEYEKVEQYIAHHFDHIDSSASDRVIDWIVYDKMPEDIKEGLARVKRENEHRRALDFLPEGYKRTAEGVVGQYNKEGKS